MQQLTFMVGMIDNKQVDKNIQGDFRHEGMILMPRKAEEIRMD